MGGLYPQDGSRETPFHCGTRLVARCLLFAMALFILIVLFSSACFFYVAGQFENTWMAADGHI